MPSLLPLLLLLWLQVQTSMQSRPGVLSWRCCCRSGCCRWWLWLLPCWCLLPQQPRRPRPQMPEAASAAAASAGPCAPGLLGKGAPGTEGMSGAGWDSWSACPCCGDERQAVCGSALCVCEYLREQCVRLCRGVGMWVLCQGLAAAEVAEVVVAPAGVDCETWTAWSSGALFLVLINQQNMLLPTLAGCWPGSAHISMSTHTTTTVSLT